MKYSFDIDITINGECVYEDDLVEASSEQEAIDMITDWVKLTITAADDYGITYGEPNIDVTVYEEDEEVEEVEE